jgi:1-acyl-sn-glycerol-3-phosphate acyltransferase
LQYIVVSQGPIIKFLIKRELIFVPVVGWICLALNFPRLSRGKDKQSRREDYNLVANATMELSRAPIALVNFAEGTRFTPEKHHHQHSPYQHLLLPRSGGMRIMLDSMTDATVLDVTLVYPEDLTFWQCLSGRLNSITVHLSYYPVSDIDNIENWLAERWQTKDKLFAKTRASYSEVAN